MKRIWRKLKNFLREHLDYQNGKLRHITRMFDRGIISLSLEDWNSLTPFQQMSIMIITDEIVKFRSVKDSFLTY